MCKKNEILPLAANYMHLGLSISQVQKEKDRYPMRSLSVSPSMAQCTCLWKHKQFMAHGRVDLQFQGEGGWGGE